MIGIADLRQKSSDELQEELQNLKREQLNLRFQRASGQLEATSRGREVRRDIARIKTVVTERLRDTAAS